MIHDRTIDHLYTQFVKANTLCCDNRSKAEAVLPDGVGSRHGSSCSSSKPIIIVRSCTISNHEKSIAISWCMPFNRVHGREPVIASCMHRRWPTGLSCGGTRPVRPVDCGSLESAKSHDLSCSQALQHDGVAGRLNATVHLCRQPRLQVVTDRVDWDCWIVRLQSACYGDAIRWFHLHCSDLCIGRIAAG